MEDACFALLCFDLDGPDAVSEPPARHGHLPDEQKTREIPPNQITVSHDPGTANRPGKWPGRRNE